MPKLIAANFHYIRNSFQTPFPGIFGVTPEKFESQLKTLASYGDFIGAEDVIRLVNGETLLKKDSFIITFDDGLYEQYEMALPVLDKLGIPAVFFVNTQQLTQKNIAPVHKVHLLLANVPFEEYKKQIFSAAAESFGKTEDMVPYDKAVIHYNYDTPDRAVLKYFLNICLSFEEQSKVVDEVFHALFPGEEERMWQSLYMTHEQVRHLDSMSYLGSHSHRHMPLGLYTKDEITEDIVNSKNILQDITGRKPVAISYPYGSFESSGKNVQHVAAEHGFTFGFTMERAGNSAFHHPLGLARFDCNDVPGGKSCADGDAFMSSIKETSWFNS